MVRVNRIVTVALAVSLLACAVPMKTAADPTVATTPMRWQIFRDVKSPANNGIWSNWMPKEAADMISVENVERDKNGDTCMQFTVKFRAPDWAGVAVSSVENYWGEEPGPAYNLQGAKKLVFWARGDAGGEQIVVKMAIAGDKRFGDSRREPIESEWVKLTKQWHKYEVPLSGDLSRVVTPFVWVTDKRHNTAQSIRFMIDDVSVEW